MSHNRVITPINELHPSELKIGKRFALVRGNRTSKDFAKSLGVHPNSITNYENDKRFPDLSVLTHLVEDYRVNLNWLLTGHGNVYDDMSIETSSGDASMSKSKNGTKKVDQKVFATALQMANEFEKRGGGKLMPSDKIEIVYKIYQDIMDKEQD